jgi:hypothetical protein
MGGNDARPHWIHFDADHIVLAKNRAKALIRAFTVSRDNPL